MMMSSMKTISDAWRWSGSSEDPGPSSGARLIKRPSDQMEWASKFTMELLYMKGTSKTDSAMASEEESRAKERFIRVTFLKTRWKETDSSLGLMAGFTKASGSPVKSMATASTSGQTGKFTMVNSKTTVAMEKALFTIPMEKFSLVCGETVSRTAKESMCSPTAPSIKSLTSMARRQIKAVLKIQMQILRT